MKVLAIADTHCGHYSGLTMPAFWNQRHLELESKCWEWFDAKTKEHGPYDIAIWNGDLIDGPGGKSGGSEIIETDMHNQAEMATEIVKHINAPTNVFSYGTPYHTSPNGSDYERQIASAVGGHISDHPIIEIEGVTLSVRHHASRAETSLLNEKKADVDWADSEDRDRADIILRAHNHTYRGRFGVDYKTEKEWAAILQPCLQMWTKFGGRRVTSSPITYGFIVLEINNGGFSWQTHRLSLKGSREVLKF